MLPKEQGSIGLFQFRGIPVYLHWTWFIVAVYLISPRDGQEGAGALALNAAVCVTLFAIVLLHEFGHALACRQVGGRADKIILWPLGGLAIVAPPQRAGAQLWSIAAGPLVNVALVPVLAGVEWACQHAGLFSDVPGLRNYLIVIQWINGWLFVFNVLPVYPLDGGQILRSLLWFRIGPIRSLYWSSIVGFFGVAGLAVFAIAERRIWMGLLVLFVFSRCWDAFRFARAQMAIERAPKNADCACPLCGAHPPAELAVPCTRCGQPFDPFATRGDCPHCPTTHPSIRCVACGAVTPIEMWSAGRR